MTHLKTITDPKDRHPELEHFGVDVRCVLVVNGIW